MVRVDFFADLPVARRLTPSVTFTDPLAFFRARLTAADGFSVTDFAPAEVNVTLPDASVVFFRPNCLATFFETVSVAVPVIASVAVTRIARPDLLNAGPGRPARWSPSGPPA